MKAKTLIFSLLILICSVMNSQNIPNEAYGKTLPYTWEFGTTIGKYVCTLNPDGTIISRLISPCRCVYGRCSVCGGLGSINYGYSLGWISCRACFGTGRCNSCQGNGYTVISMYTTTSGATIGVDEHGRSYLAYPESNSTSKPSSQPTKCDRCDGTGKVVKMNPAFTGLSDWKYCKECKKDVPLAHYHTDCSVCGGKGYL